MAFDIPAWLYLYVPGVVVILIAAFMIRAIFNHDRRINEHAERITWLEAKINGKDRK